MAHLLEREVEIGACDEQVVGLLLDDAEELEHVVLRDLLRPEHLLESAAVALELREQTLDAYSREHMYEKISAKRTVQRLVQ